MKKMKPETAGTTIIGSRKKSVSEPAAAELLQEQQREREADQELDADGDAAMNHTVSHIACQKLPLVSASQ